MKNSGSGGTSLVDQWLRIHLGMKGLWDQSLVRELRSHMHPSNEALELQLLSLHATTKDPACREYS